MARADMPRTVAKKVADNTAKGAMAGTLEVLFEDMYQRRWVIYKMNFVRGMMFAFGGVIGGTIVVALLLWALSLFNQLPFLGHLTEAAQKSIENSQQK